MISTTPSLHNPGGQEHSRFYSLFIHRAESVPGLSQYRSNERTNEWIQCYFPCSTLPHIVGRWWWPSVALFKLWKGWWNEDPGNINSFPKLDERQEPFFSLEFYFIFLELFFFIRVDRKAPLDQNPEEREAFVLLSFLNTCPPSCAAGLMSTV